MKKIFLGLSSSQMRKEKDNPTSFRLSVEIRERLDRLAKKSEMPLQIVINAALKAGLAEIESGRFNPFTGENRVMDEPTAIAAEEPPPYVTKPKKSAGR